MKLVTFSVACALALTACATKVQLTSQFDLASVAPMLRPGPNQISGSALIRQAGGGVVTCAGGDVYMMPVSAYAKEWARALYGSETQGYFRTQGGGINFTNIDQSFAGAVRSTGCNAQGFFNFPEVADGDFYVFTKINWRVAGETQGGSIMKSVSARGGQKQELVLAP